jgi:hypothetical protein
MKDNSVNEAQETNEETKKNSEQMAAVATQRPKGVPRALNRQSDKRSPDGQRKFRTLLEYGIQS